MVCFQVDRRRASPDAASVTSEAGRRPGDLPGDSSLSLGRGSEAAFLTKKKDGGGHFSWPEKNGKSRGNVDGARRRRMMSVVDRDLAFARLAELMPTVRARYGVLHLAVFGSVGRGEASESSDLDVLVDFVGSATFDGYMGLKLFLEDSLGVRVDLVTRAALKPRLRARIEAEARRVA